MRELGQVPGRSPRIGVLYPCSGTRDADFWALAPAGASVHITRLPFNSDASAEAISAMSSDDNLRAAATLVAAVQPDVVVWADTSGSFLFGPRGDARQARLLSEVTGVAATTTSTGLVAACAALKVDRVDMATPYVPELNAALIEFLAARGVTVERMESLDLDDSYEIASVPDDEQRALLRAAQGSAPALLVPCTDFLTLTLIPDLEEELDRPVIAANPATMWHACRLLKGSRMIVPTTAGRLFRARDGVSS